MLTRSFPNVGLGIRNTILTTGACSYHLALGREIVLAESKSLPSFPRKTGGADFNGSLATAEMRVIIARLLWNFDLALQEQSRTWIDMKVYNLWEKRPLMVKLTQAIRN